MSGRPFCPFSRAISFRCSATIRFNDETSPRSCTISIFSPKNDSESISRGGIPRMNRAAALFGNPKYGPKGERPTWVELENVSPQPSTAHRRDGFVCRTNHCLRPALCSHHCSLGANVRRHPNAAWVAQEINEAFPWNQAPRYLIRDHEPIYGSVVVLRLRAFEIRGKPIAPHCPWQNGHAESLFGTTRMECVDHLILPGEAHLRGNLREFAAY